MMFSELPQSVKSGIVISSIWVIATIAIWIGLGMYTSPYYRFGPSDTLTIAFTGIKIDTGYKYFVVVLFIVLSTLLKVVGGDWVYPWINAVAMNPEVRLNQQPLLVYFVVNYYWSINSLYGIFFFSLSFSQVDFALYSMMSAIVGGLFSSWFIICRVSRSAQPMYEQL